jgi:hypothetical protein
VHVKAVDLEGAKSLAEDNQKILVVLKGHSQIVS